jgi:PAS domain S-box-containing protein
VDTPNPPREAHHRAIFNSPAVGIALMDREQRIIECNAKFAQMMGHSPQELVGKSIFDPAASGEVPKNRDVLRQLAGRKGATAQFEKAYVRRDGTILPARVTVALVDGAGEVGDAYATAVIEDLTERKLSEMRERAAKEELRKSNDQLKVIFEAVADGILVQDVSGTIVFANQASAQICGFPTAESLMRATVSQVLENFETLTEDGKPLSVSEMPARRIFAGDLTPREIVIVVRNKRTGQKSIRTTTARPILDSTGKATHTVSLMRDISVQREVEAQFRTLAESIPHLAFIAAGDDGRVTWVNRGYAEYRGLPREAIVGWGFKEGFNPETVDATLARIRAAVETGQPFEYEIEIRGANGDYRWFLVRAVPIKGLDGRVDRWFGTATDIHDQRQEREYSNRLLELTTELSRTVTIEGVGHAVTQVGLKVLAADRCMVLLLSDDGEFFREGAIVGKVPGSVLEILKSGRFRSKGSLPAHQAIRTGEPVFLETPEQHDREFPEAKSIRLETATQSAAFIPLRSGERALGILAVGYSSPRKFIPRERTFLLGVARQCAEAVERALLFEKLKGDVASRDEFLSVATHELKTPLTSLKLQAQLNRRKISAGDSRVFERESVKKLVETTDQQVDRLAKLIDDMLSRR